MPIMSSLALQLASRLKEKGISAAELSRRSKLSSSFISRLLSGEQGKRVSKKTLESLAQALDISSTEFTPQFLPFQRLNEIQELCKTGEDSDSDNPCCPKCNQTINIRENDSNYDTLPSDWCHNCCTEFVRKVRPFLLDLLALKNILSRILK